ncbi:MAG: glycosyltransferase [Prevotella sp.]|nr:glycosyltransferase [Prevotella sp.]
MGDIKTKISIIIPVYNCADYLSDCIDSVLAENDFYDIEILLIDDGSTDKSGKICDTYSNEYEQVRTVHTSNQGVSSARNLGLRIATGEWIMFVDGDDVLDSNTLTYLDKEAKFYNYDVTKFGAYRFGQEKKKPYVKKFCNDIEKFRYLVIAKEAVCGVWGAIYSRRLFTENNIKFNKDIDSGEDWLVLFKILCHTQKFQYCDINLYGYRINPNSVTKTKIKYVRTDVMRAYNLIIDYAIENDIYIPKPCKYKAKSEIRVGAMKDAVFSKSRVFFEETDKAIRKYVPQSFWKDIKYRKKLKHIIVFLCYRLVSICIKRVSQNKYNI